MFFDSSKIASQMTPQRWREIEQIYQSATDVEADSRDAFLAKACHGDEALRREVESLLELSNTQLFIDQPAWNLAVELLDDEGELAPGTELGRYSIQVLLGSGRTGKVYRATDTRLSRPVALKVSRVELGSHFEREARVIAALSHPNIGALYDVGHNYLVMELVEGVTLSQRIKEGPIPLDEALKIAWQIVAALAAAHENGIIHGDLKPDNIKMKPDGTVKVLDFGLAELSNPSTVTLQDSRTIDAITTQPRLIPGTGAYVSPEQAQGKPLDKRTDVWAFGVVLHEMLTGKPVFGRDTVSDTLAAVLKEEPEWNRIPIKVQRLLRTCLQKSPDDRLSDIRDTRLLLEDKPHGLSNRTLLAWTAAVLLLTALATIAFVHFRERSPVPPAPIRFEVQLRGMTNSPSFSISPDGRRLVFVATGSDGARRLWIRALDSIEARPLAGSETIRRGIRNVPFWSPDGRYVAFDAGGKLKKIDIFSSVVQTLCDVPANIAGGSWNNDGVIIFGVDEPGYGLMRVPAAGGVPSQVTNALTDPAQGAVRHLFPVLLPDGKHFLYRQNGSSDGIYAGSLDAKPEEQPATLLLQSDNTVFSYLGNLDSGPGQLLFMRDGILLAQAFDAERLQPAGEAVPIVDNVDDASGDRDVPSSLFSVSRNNVLVYTNGSGRSLQLSWFDRQGNVLQHLGQSAQSVALSPDGTKIAFSRVINPPRDGAIWLMDVVSGLNSQLTFISGLELYPIWSADATRIAFTFFPGDASGYSGYQKLSNGAGNEEPLIKSKPTVPSDWSRDGNLLYWVRDPKTKSDLWVLPAGSGRAFPVVATESNELYGKFSPDGRSVAYVSDESGKEEIYVVPFAVASDGHVLSSEGKRRVSTNGGVGVHWRRDGNELFYLSPDGTIMAVDVRNGVLSGVDSAPVFRYGSPQRLFRTATTNPFAWDVAPDGQRFLISAEVGSPAPTVVVLNWRSLLKN